MTNNSKVTVYTKDNCIYCEKAKALLKGLSYSFTEKKYGKDFKTSEDLYEAVGKKVRTMPQIVVDDKLLGGYNQLVEYFVEQGKVNFKGEINK